MALAVISHSVCGGVWMSVERLQMVLKLANFHDDDRLWFGRWLRQ